MQQVQRFWVKIVKGIQQVQHFWIRNLRDTADTEFLDKRFGSCSRYSISGLELRAYRGYSISGLDLGGTVGAAFLEWRYCIINGGLKDWKKTLSR